MSLSSKEEVLNGLSIFEKIAILLIHVGEDLTAKIFSYMEVETIKEISKYIATAKDFDKSVVTAVLEEFYMLFQSNEYISRGGIDYTKEVLYKALGADKAQNILEELSKTIQAQQSFNFLEKITPKQLADFIIKEHPQTIALILAYVNPDIAAKTLKYFPDELRAEVLVRISNLKDISPEIIKKISSILETKLNSILDTKIGGVQYVVEVLNKFDPLIAKSTIEYMKEINNEVVKEITNNLFTFEDILKVEDIIIKEALKKINKDILMIALKGAPSEIKKKFLSNMSPKVAYIFEKEIDFLGPIKIKEIEIAQEKIMDVFREIVNNKSYKSS